MDCPECSATLRAKARFCSCGWKVGSGSNNEAGVKYAVCYGCQQELPWPGVKEARAAHRIIGLTFRNSPICNRCYERSPEWDWRAEVFRDFDERHKDDNWHVLLLMAHALKGAPKEDCAEFMGYLKEEARKAGGLTKRLPYDPSKRERA